MSAATCIRCKQPLPEGSGYCVACGCQNESALGKKGQAHLALDQRERRASFWRRIADSIPLFRFLR